MATGSKPVQRFSSGMITVSIFRNVTKGGTFYSVQANRAYKKDGSDKWEYTTSFQHQHICIVQRLYELALQWIEENGGVDPPKKKRGKAAPPEEYDEAIDPDEKPF